MYPATAPLPGWTLPGCGGVDEMLDGLRRGVRPAGPVVLAGDGAELFDAAAVLLRRCVPVAGIVIASQLPVPAFPAAPGRAGLGGHAARRGGGTRPR